MFRIKMLALLLVGNALFGAVPIRDASAQTADDELLRIPPSQTTKTVPRSPYEHPGQPLIQQEAGSHNSGASQEVNKNLNEEYGNYDSSKK